MRIPIRREFHQYANMRPVRLLKGITSPLRDRTAKDIDFIVVRENNEGETLVQRPPDRSVVTPPPPSRGGVPRALAWVGFGIGA